MISIIKKKLFLLLITLLLVVILVSCQTKSNLIKPTKAFYINDSANALLTSTKQSIYFYSKMLYEDSNNDKDYVNEKINGAQVVVLTYNGNVGDFNNTDLFNYWGIGKNNMGILIILFYDAFNNYTDLTFEIGIKMSEYLPVFEADLLISSYFNDPSIPSSDIDLRLIALYFSVLEYLYLDVYNYNSYDYDSFVDQFLENKYNTYNTMPSEAWTFTDLMPLWAWILVIIFLIGIGFTTNAFGIILSLLFGSSSNQGGGGKSIGYWFKR